MAVVNDLMQLALSATRFDVILNNEKKYLRNLSFKW